MTVCPLDITFNSENDDNKEDTKKAQDIGNPSEAPQAPVVAILQRKVGLNHFPFTVLLPFLKLLICLKIRPNLMEIKHSRGLLKWLLILG